MPSCRYCNLRVLVGISIPITAVLLGLCIWKIVDRVQRAMDTPTLPFKFCENGGTFEKDGCICQEQWKGLRCTIVNFCKTSTDGNFHFDNITVGRYGPSREKCESSTTNGFPKATRFCNITIYGEIILGNISETDCNLSLKKMANEANNITENSLKISLEVQTLTSDAIVLTNENISYATIVVEQLFNKSKNATALAKQTAVTTVSQLLDAKEESFQNAGSFKSLITELESYSLSLINDSVVRPNIAIRSVELSTENTSQPISVTFSVQRGANDILDLQQTDIETNKDNLQPGDQTELEILINTTQSANRTVGFVLYQNSKFFQSKKYNISKSNFSHRIVASKISGDDASSARKEIPNVSVEMIFKPKYDRSKFLQHSYACVFWNITEEDWSTSGCKKKPTNNSEFVGCQCNHTTNFAVLISFMKNYAYPEPLDIISNIGCGLSSAGLALTIIFQVATRKLRKTSVTWVFVNLCTSMLIFNILFVFGIENTNKNINNMNDNKDDNVIHDYFSEPLQNHTCTVITALLHYFLLVTFTWTALNAVQLYYLLLRTMKPLPEHFILYLSLIGWGIPAIVVALTVGIIFPLKGVKAYRQERICWLAIPEDDNYLHSPLLWSFILPVAVILITNTVIFILIMVKVLWGRNDNLTSTKKNSVMKKILSTLSIAVVFGITWILAYLMLIDNHNLKHILNYFFCLFNTTQGLQIFLLYTVKTKIFQNKVSDVLKSISSTTGNVKVPSLKLISLHSNMYNMLRSFPSRIERFTLLETAYATKETLLSERS